MADEVTIGDLGNYPTPDINSIVEIEELTDTEDPQAGNMTLKQVFNMMQGYFNGSYDYDDAATATTPLVGVSGVPLALTNDNNGPYGFSNPPTSMGAVWDVINQQFDFSSFGVGDRFSIRLDAEITTTNANQDVYVYLEMNQGGVPFNVNYGRSVIKSAGTYQIGRLNGLHLGSTTVKNSPAQFKIVSDGNFTLVVKGWYVKVVRSVI